METGSKLVYDLAYCKTSRLLYAVLSPIEVGVFKVRVSCLCTIKFLSQGDQACLCKELFYGLKNVSACCGRCLVKENYFRMNQLSEAIIKSLCILVRWKAKSSSGQRLNSGTVAFCCLPTSVLY